jgi:hypothetical protein
MKINLKTEDTVPELDIKDCPEPDKDFKSWLKH